MFCIWFETDHTFRPDIKDGSATGLIQFEPGTAAELGTSIEQLAQMSPIEQLQYVEKYLAGKIKEYGLITSLGDCYLAIFYPAAIKEGPNYTFSGAIAKENTIFSKGRPSFTTKDVINTIYAEIPKKYQALYN